MPKILNMQFLRNLLANIVGLFVFGAIVLLSILIIAALSSDKPQVPVNAVLHISLDNNLVDRPNSSEFNFVNSAHCGNGLLSIQKSLKLAKTDDAIKAVFIEVGELTGSLANVSSLRRSINDFKESGKKVIAYSEGMSQIGYYLSSSADSVYTNNLAYVEWKGLGAQLLYFKSMLNKIGVKAEPIRVGEFKSAIEPFIMDTISSSNHKQVKEMLGDVWSNLVEDVSKDRGVNKVFLNKLADEKAFLMPKEALQAGLIDGIRYPDEINDLLKSISGEDMKLISVGSYNAANENPFQSGDKIVVVNAEGAIIDAKSETDISGVKYGKILDDVLKDKSVKAVVLRINSPGGSALASEKLWRKLKLIQAEMPLVVSMGNVAASGGYYLASAADTVFAEKNTITGSIGVFGLMFNVSELTKTVGVNVEKVKTNEMSDFPSFDRDLTAKEKSRIQTGVNSIYKTFIERVKDGRSMSQENVEKLAQGRVWTGKQAYELGLVDSLGGLNEAIELAAELADVKNKRVVHLPKELSPLEAVVKHLSSQSKVYLPAPFEQYNYMIENPDFFQSFSKPQVRLPYILSID